ncbi:MAG: hypothetical protein Solumvirus2_23 [Solumvirus sp.]|uniref:Fatty acid hydroxylase domain-containing protein n=1 Tax=Solumvirus sp. TaxID=2487773 RepID=A0A3G5AG68_9VIRU|nr:MAG: hypothetical protein Solumvirus2_23 [Solumvirus sp.]
MISSLSSQQKNNYTNPKLHLPHTSTSTSICQYLLWIFIWLHPFVDRDYLSSLLSLDFFMMYSIWFLPLLCSNVYRWISESKLFEDYKLISSTMSIKDGTPLEKEVDNHFWKSQGLTTVAYWTITRLFDIKFESVSPTPTAPSRLTSIIQVLVSLLIADFHNYWVHRLFHSTSLYKYHKKHHQFVDPVPMAVNWLSELEIITITMPILFVPIFLFKMHPITILLWTTVTVTRGYYEHCHYDLPFDPFQLIPFNNNVKLHDDHHRFGGGLSGTNGRSGGNYGSYFHYCDYLFGTLILRE